MRYLNNKTEEKLPYFQTYIYILVRSKKEMEGVYIHLWFFKKAVLQKDSGSVDLLCLQ